MGKGIENIQPANIVGKEDIGGQLEQKFFERYRQNVFGLKETGIVDIFEEMIEEKVVVLIPKGELRIKEYKHNLFFNKNSYKIKTLYSQEQPAYISWEEAIFDPENPEDFSKCGAKVYLNFNKHWIEDPLASNGKGRFGPTRISASYNNGIFNLGDNAENILDIEKKDLVLKVNEEINKIKEITLSED